MRQKAYEMKTLKYKLRDLKDRRISYVDWKLNKQQLEYVKARFFTEPLLYEMKTKTFQNVRNLPYTLLKDIHYANKRGKKFLTRKLTEDEKCILDSYGIHYRILKYRIHLQSEK